MVAKKGGQIREGTWSQDLVGHHRTLQTKFARVCTESMSIFLRESWQQRDWGIMDSRNTSFISEFRGGSSRLPGQRNAMNLNKGYAFSPLSSFQQKSKISTPTQEFSSFGQRLFWWSLATCDGSSGNLSEH